MDEYKDIRRLRLQRTREMMERRQEMQDRLNRRFVNVLGPGQARSLQAQIIAMMYEDEDDMY